MLAGERTPVAAFARFAYDETGADQGIRGHTEHARFLSAFCEDSGAIA